MNIFINKYNNDYFDISKIRIDKDKYTIQHIKNLIENKFLLSNKDFKYNPIWAENKIKSLLIESIILRIPISPILLYEDECGNFHIIDGMQRISVIYDFITNRFQLTDLVYLKNECENKSFSDLKYNYVCNILHYMLDVNITDARTPIHIREDLFNRMKTIKI